MMRRQRGFTLIELMIVVAIIGIMAKLAYPWYQDSVLKGKRGQGRAAVTALLQQQERYMTQRNCYLAFTTDSGGNATAVAASGVTCPAAATVPFKTMSGESLGQSSYLLSATTCPAISGVTPTIAECVQVHATPVHSDPKVGTLSMTSSGAKSCTGTEAAKPGVCWP